MRSLKKFAVVALAVLALSSLAVASASAATGFTAEESGPLIGHSVSDQLFEMEFGYGRCESVTASGEVVAPFATSQVVTMQFGGLGNCWVDGFYTTITPMKYEITAEGVTNKIHILEPVYISIPSWGCGATIPVQTVESVSFASNGPNLIEEIQLTGMHYIGSGGLCYPSGKEMTNGRYRGQVELESPLGEIGFQI